MAVSQKLVWRALPFVLLVCAACVQTQGVNGNTDAYLSGKTLDANAQSTGNVQVIDTSKNPQVKPTASQWAQPSFWPSGGTSPTLPPPAVPTVAPTTAPTATTTATAAPPASGTTGS